MIDSSGPSVVSRGAAGAESAGHAAIDALTLEAWRLRHDDSRRALTLARQALALAEQAAYPRGRAWALLRVCVCELIVAEPGCPYESRLGECIDLMRDLADLPGEAEAMNLLGILRESQGELCESIALHRRCLALHQAVGDLRGQAMALNNMSPSLFDIGCADEALQSLQDSLALAEQATDPAGMAYALVGLGRLLCQMAQGEAAVAHCERAFAQVARTEDRALECTALTWLARARALLGEFDVATGLLQHAQALAQRTGNVGDAARVQLALAVVAQGRELHAESEPHLHAALGLSQRAGERRLEAGVRWHLARALRSMGQTTAALAQLALVRGAAQAMNHRQLLARVDTLAQEIDAR